LKDVMGEAYGHYGLIAAIKWIGRAGSKPMDAWNIPSMIHDTPDINKNFDLTGYYLEGAGGILPLVKAKECFI
jgi:hypothetical protein